MREHVTHVAVAGGSAGAACASGPRRRPPAGAFSHLALIGAAATIILAERTGEL